jgi:hypothetical protein
MKIGRNAPCPCGSGRKYKKCCLPRDEEQARSAAAATTPARPVQSSPHPAPPPDPRIEAWNARWEAFEAQDYEGQITLFTETCDDPELMDDEMAFEMLNTLHSQALERDQRDRFDRLVESLQTHLPAAYASSSNYYLYWRITNALATGRFDAVPPLVRDMATTAKHDIDILNNVIDALAYHGQLPLIVEATRLAWPWVQEPGNVVPWGIDEFGFQAVHFVLLEYSTHHPEPDPEDPALVEQIENYHPRDPEGVQRYLAHLTGQAGSSWSMDDFTFQRSQPSRRDRFDDFDDEEDEPQQAPSDPARRNFFALSVAFLGHLHRDEGIPLSKGELARRQLFEYILERFDGELEPRESLLDTMRRPKQRRPKPRRRQPDHLLCPDHDTLDRFLAQRMDFINPQWYKTAAMFELLPAWLRFLELRGLVDAEQHTKSHQDIEPLVPSLRQIWERHLEDPSLQRGLQACWG